MKYLKILIIVILVALAAFFLYQQFQPDAPTDQELEAMKQSIVSDPVVKDETLTEEQRQQFLDRFESAKERLIELNFDHLQTINEIAMVKKSLGDIEGAITAWEYANIIRPQNSLSFANLAALYHFDLGNFEKAEENYLISIANDPDDIPTIRNFYTLYHTPPRGFEPDNKKAEALLLQSIENNPEMADLYSLAGSFYKDIGERDKAIEMFERHLELNPGNEAVQRELDKLRQQQ